MDGLAGKSNGNSILLFHSGRVWASAIGSFFPVGVNARNGPRKA
jgi:hypothetical protein